MTQVTSVGNRDHCEPPYGLTALRGVGAAAGARILRCCWSEIAEMHRRLGDQSHSRTVTCGCPPRSADLADSEGQLGIR